MSRLIMAIDANKCMNCKACIVACQQRNSVPYNHDRNWIKAAVAPEAPSGWHYQPGGCMQCDKPQCVDACPTGATYKGDDGVVYVNPGKCIGCGCCITACPYDARYKDATRGGIVDKCDYCLSSRQRGLAPACVSICPTHARVFGDADDPNSDVAKLLAANKDNLTYVKASEVDTQPSLVYIGATTPADWPRNTEIPTPIRAMDGVSKAVSWLGGLCLLGIGGVIVKQLVAPSDKDEKKDGQDEHKQD